jgi:predicted glycosyltransferase
VAKDDPKKEATMAETARQWFDLVLVHGDPSIVPFGDSFPYADRLSDLIEHTGFVSPARPVRSIDTDMSDGVDEIIVSVGGGAVGYRLLEAASEAARLPHPRLASQLWRLLVGPDISKEDFDRLVDQAPEGAIVERARPDFTALLSRCSLSISQAGYNTVMDVLVAGCRALYVPFAQGGESEQSRRAELMADRGWARCLPEADLTAALLAETITTCLSLPKPGDGRSIALSGAETSVQLLHQKFIGL